MLKKANILSVTNQRAPLSLMKRRKAGIQLLLIDLEVTKELEALEEQQRRTLRFRFVQRVRKWWYERTNVRVSREKHKMR